MSRYIDAEKIEYKHTVVFIEKEDEMSVYKSEIDAMPTADVVEIVRCKDCIHGTKDFDKFLCEWNQEFHDGDWFCADGERREDDEGRR